MNETRDAVVRHGTERYTEQQLVEILKRASERQDGLTTEPDGRFSLEEIQQIAAEVGIAPAHIAAAAAELNEATQPPTSSFLGAPTAFRFERWIEGEIPRSAIGELFDMTRREFGVQGQISEALDMVEWRARAGLGAVIVSVARRFGRTQIAIHVTRGDAAALVVTTTGVAGAAGAAAIGSAFAATALSVGPIAVAAVVVVSLGWGGAGAWAAMTGIWRAAARRWPARVESLGKALVLAAQHAIEAARNDNG